MSADVSEPMSTDHTDSSGPPTLSLQSVALINELLSGVTLPVTHPQLAEVAVMWAQVTSELADITRFRVCCTIR